MLELPVAYDQPGLITAEVQQTSKNAKIMAIKNKVGEPNITTHHYYSGKSQLSGERSQKKNPQKSGDNLQVDTEWLAAIQMSVERSQMNNPQKYGDSLQVNKERLVSVQGIPTSRVPHIRSIQVNTDLGASKEIRDTSSWRHWVNTALESVSTGLGARKGIGDTLTLKGLH